MIRLKLDTSQAASFLGQKDLEAAQQEIRDCHRVLMGRKGKGKDFLGWLDLPSGFPEELLQRIRSDAEKIRSHSDLLIVIGIGGSYLGARAVIEALEPSSGLPAPSTGKHPLRVLYAGHHLGEEYHKSLLQILDHYSYSLAVISKSGTTTEPAVAFRLLKDHLLKKYGGKGAKERIIAVTDASRGGLKKLADTQGYPSYVIPDDVGGRFSVLTPVGLIPIAAAGFDIVRLLSGAREMEQTLKQSVRYGENPAQQYAAVRNLLYRAGRTTEILASFEPGMHYLAEWWKQLFGESEGKEHKGIFPAAVGFTTDLHSMGQFIQDGSRNLFETVLSFGPASTGPLAVPGDPEDPDGLNFLAGKSLYEINRMAELGTRLAHVDGGVPNIRLEMPQVDEAVLGELLYFFEFSCALSGYALGVNPFDQPGVEAYKKNMFALLGKPGFEEEGKKLRKRLE
ncbi:MAG TPA: glucose-6-phosphate isomerase [Bacteroidales bacterium]|nr:glucose-6-phosphate isomerase [Bacteroidales bacterium]